MAKWDAALYEEYPNYPDTWAGYDIAYPTGPITCSECGTTKSRRRFHRLMAVNNMPEGYRSLTTSVCIDCRAKKTSFETAVKVIERSHDRAAAQLDKEQRSRRSRMVETRKERDVAIKARLDARKAASEERKAEQKRVQEQKKAVLQAETDAERELASRALAKIDLLHYIERFHPDYKAGWVHEDICRRLRQFVEDVENKKSPRLILNMPPRAGKSMIASENFPSWVLGKHPDWEFIATSYALDLPIQFSRKVRERLRDPRYKQLFPDTSLHPDSQAAEMWRTTKEGGYRAAGVGGGITGLGAGILVIDDPVKDQSEADSETIRQSAWDWYTTTAYTRLAPGGGVLLIQCMTGDTPVLMASGAYKRLDSIQVGDEVATFDGGRLSTSKVLRWASQGDDDIFAMTMSSGKIIRANERHPFLVETHTGALEWVRLKDLRSGQKIVTVKDNGVNGEERLVVKTDAKSPSPVEGSANPTTTRPSGLLGIAHHLRYRLGHAKRVLNTAMGSLLVSTTSCSEPKTENVLSVVCLNTQSNPQDIGHSGSVSTTTLQQGKLEDCSVTIATCCSSGGTTKRCCAPLYDTENFTTQTVLSIEPAGRAEVFDIQVDRTENFIANVVISHNTRWHDDDLSGRIELRHHEVRKEEDRLNSEYYLARKERNAERMEQLAAELKLLRDSNDRWEIVKYPAIATHREVLDQAGHIRQSTPDHPVPGKLLREPGEALHPERFNLPLLLKIKQTLQPRHWSALYQQNPIPDEGLFFTKDMLRYEPHVPDYREMHIFAAWDLAVGTKNLNDYTVGVVGALDWTDTLHVIDLVRMRANTHHTVETILDIAQKYKVQITGIEKGPLELAIRPQLEKRMQERRFYPPFAEGNDALKPVTDKIARARPLQGRMQQGKVILPANQPWVDSLVHEFLRFPGGVHDDIVDAMAWLMRLVMTQAPPPEPRHNRGYNNHESWKARLNGFLGSQKTWMSS